MSNVTMWWVQSKWWWDAPGASITLGSSGRILSGTINGPTSGFLTMYERVYRIQFTSSFWLGPNRIPPTGCEWESLATDMMTGSITGSTRGGIYPFGPWPATTLREKRRQRVYSGSTLLFQEEQSVSIIDIWEEEWKTVTSTVPLYGVYSMFSGRKFDFDRSKVLYIELELELRVFFRGDGTISFGTGVSLNLPQFDIRSTL